jgi:hypothetical protein
MIAGSFYARCYPLSVFTSLNYFSKVENLCGLFLNRLWVAHSVSCHSLNHTRNVQSVGVHWTRGHDEDCTGFGDMKKTALDSGTRWSLSGQLSSRRETIETSAASRASSLSDSARAWSLLFRWSVGERGARRERWLEYTGPSDEWSPHTDSGEVEDKTLIKFPNCKDVVIGEHY